MTDEVKALTNRGCWRVFRTPNGVRLIKSKFVYKLKKDWTGKVTKRKSRLVVLGCLQREGIDYEESAPEMYVEVLGKLEKTQFYSSAGSYSRVESEIR